MGYLLKVLLGSPTTAVNVRLLHGDDSAGVGRHFKQLAEKLGYGNMEVTQLLTEEPSQVPPAAEAVYEQLVGCILGVWPGVVATPYLVMGGTDSRKYYNVCDHIYRFTPLLVTSQEKDTMHGTNESVEVENYARMIAFLRRFISNFK